MNEGPVVFGLTGAHAGVEGRLRAGRQAGEGGRGRHRGLEGPAVRALDALTFARVAGVGAPTAARLIQTLATCSVPGAVLRCSKTHNRAGYLKTELVHTEFPLCNLRFQLINYCPMSGGKE